MKKLTVSVLAVSLSFHSTPATTPAVSPLPANVERALAAVGADELKGDLSFLASDALQGRFTPSPGLEVAAEFIASKFRAAGLEPGGDRDYFQMAEMVDRRLPSMTAALTMFVGDRTVVVPASEVTVEATSQAARLDHVPVVFFLTKDAAQLKGVDLLRKAVVAVEADLLKLSGEDLRAERRKARAFDQAIASSGALMNLTVLHNRRSFVGPPRLLFLDQAAAGRTPSLAVHSEELAKLVADFRQEASSLSVDIPAPLDNKVIVKNVIGILRGSDPALAKTAVLLTAHYDHIGTVETAGQMSMHSAGDSPDRIYNGANDDGSGTVSVIEIARALSKDSTPPKTFDCLYDFLRRRARRTRFAILRQASRVPD